MTIGNDLEISTPEALECLFRAGLAQIEITPIEPAVLGGYGVAFPFSKIDAPLRAKALAIEAGDQPPVVIVSVDTLKLRQVAISPVVESLSGRLGIPSDHVIFVATHTHEAPMLPGHYGASEPFLEAFLSEDLLCKRESYFDYLRPRLEAVVMDAVTRLEPARLNFFRGTADFAVNRRVVLPDGNVTMGKNFGATVDNTVPVLQIESLNGPMLGLVFGYACHGTTVRPEIVSPDFMGYAEAQLERRFRDIVALYLPGFSADINPNPWMHDVDPLPSSDGGIANAMSHGLALSEAVEMAIKSCGCDVAGPFSISSTTARLPLASIYSRQQLMAELKDAESDPKYGPRRIARARAHIHMLDQGIDLPTDIQLPLTMLDLGALSILFMGGEVASGYGELSAQLSDRPIWPVGYARDCPSYVPTAKMIAEGGYEPNDSMVNNGWFGPLDLSSEDQIMRAVGELIERRMF